MPSYGWTISPDWRRGSSILLGALSLAWSKSCQLRDFVGACFWADRDRWALWIPVALGFGIAGYFSLPFEPPLKSGLFSVAVALALVTVLVMLRPRWESRSPRLGYGAVLTGFLLLTLTTGFLAGQMRTRMVAAPIIHQEIGPVVVEGQIESAARQPKGDWRLIIRPSRIGRLARQDMPQKIRISVRQRLTDVAPAMRIEVRAMLMPPPGPVSPDGFDFARRAWFDGIGAVGYSISTPDLTLTRQSNGLKRRGVNALNGFRQAVAEQIRTALPGAAGAVAAALLTGDREAIPEPVVDSLRAAGLAHLLAISGLHMALVGGLVFVALRTLFALFESLALNYPIKKWAAAGGLLGALFYLFVSGASISTQRAFIMISIMFVAVMLDRPAVSLRNVAFAAFGILLLRPESLLHVSFQMSFSAVVGLIAVYEWRRDRYHKLNRESWAWAHGFSPVRLFVAYLVGLAATTAIAEIMIAPIAAFHFNRVATLGIVANLVAVPLVGFLIMPMGVLALLLMPLGLEQLALVPMAWGINVVIGIAGAVSSWAGAEMATPAWPQFALILILLGGLWLALWRQSWRYGGFGLVAIGLVLALLYERPDVLVDRDGSNLAVRTSEGELVTLSGRRARFAVSRWLQGEGLLPDADQTEKRSAIFRCDTLGCMTADPGLPLVTFVTDARAFDEDCQRADLIVASVPLPRKLERSCRRHATVIDLFNLRRKGAHAIWFEDGRLRVVSAADIRGQRPWSSALASSNLLNAITEKKYAPIEGRQAMASESSTTAGR